MPGGYGHFHTLLRLLPASFDSQISFVTIGAHAFANYRRRTGGRSHPRVDRLAHTHWMIARPV